MTDQSYMSDINDPQDGVEGFLTQFGHKCVEFGYFCDQYMREEINLGEITRRMSEATGEGEAFFDTHHAMMTPEQVYRYQTMQQTLDGMTTNLIETEIKRNRQIIQEALRKGEYFIVNITFNSIHSSIYMVYSSPGQNQSERDQKLAVLQQEQELAQALMKVLKVIDQKIRPELFNDIEYRKLLKAFQIYVEYFKRVERNFIKDACDGRVLNQLRDLVSFLQTHDYFGDQYLAYQQLKLYCETLKESFQPSMNSELQALQLAIRPLDPAEELERLYQEALKAEGEANVYSAVVAFNNFAELHPNEPKARQYKREIRAALARKGYA